MAEVLLFHHALGLTAGVIRFADVLRAAGHTVHTPDLYDGSTFTTFDEGVGHARRLGFETILDRSVRIASSYGTDLVYAGMSLGSMAAQKLAQTVPGARGALLMFGAIPLGEFAPDWPAGVAAQVHVMDGDDWGDVADAKALAAASDDVELHLYPGERHLFVDSSLADQYEPAAAELMTRRVLGFLQQVAR